MHGSVELKPVLYTTKAFMFVMNSYQSVVLLLFNKHNELTYTQIKQMTNIPESELNPALLYLCNPKTRVIEKENMKKPEFAPDEKMKIAATFQNPNMRVVLSPPSGSKIKEAASAPGQPGKDVGRVATSEQEIRSER
jgi:hypothetical protein